MARRGGGGVVGHKGGNHHTQAVNIRRSQDQREAWKERIRVGNVMERLEKAFNGDITLSASQIKSAECLLDRLVPRLSAVEEVQVNELDALSREELLERIKLLLHADPTLLPELIALNARDGKDNATPPSIVQPAAKLS